ncbi:MAG: GntR family transcriptional regulator [Desulfobacterales bacterium]|nr:GntR family transcriptional regulator [Desulfobacterales bacterium]
MDPKNISANTPDFIVSTLRNAIIKGRYKANEPLRQDQLAKELGVSKIPLREALVELKSEGLVTLLPRRGAIVSGLSGAEVEEIYTMRIALETAAVEKAIPLLGNADIIRAKSVLEIIDSETEKDQWGELNWEFHANLYQAAQMPLMLKTIRNLHNNVTRYLIIYLDRLSASGKSQKEHWDLLRACQDKNIRNAVKILREHLQQASDNLVAYLSS